VEVKSPIKGRVKKLETLNDGVFSKKIMGDGVTINPSENTIYAPINGKLVTVFPTGHAYGIQAKDGTNILIHIGIDTVNLNGEGFEILVKQGKKIKQGKPIAKVNFDLIKNKVPSIEVIVIVTTDSKTNITSKNEDFDATTNDIIFTTKK
jgi:glucose-specific phosphotransferase system IIA component